MQLFSFWSFAPLTYIERLCLQSMLAAGHPVVVYTYDGPLDVPAGVVVKDANEIVQRERVFLHAESGNLGPFSDFFRYEAMRRSIGTWTDLDMLFLRDIADMGETIVGWHNDTIINGAVLLLPPDCPIFDYVHRLIHSRVPLPRHWPLRKRIRQLLRPRTIEHLEKSTI